MPPAKKLQVFVSSTYTDLKEERQAAVEAILTAGHIPAGMELFTAGDQSQLDVIRRWIDESDVFLLILGGRYGSLEPTTGKSYIQLEYEYATERGKPLFAVVIEDAALDERVKAVGKSVIEIENAALLREFRQGVLSKLVRFWSDVRDIKLSIHEKMGEFTRRSDLTGWVPGDQAVNGSLLAEEIARLTKENSELRDRLSASRLDQATFNGLSFRDMYNLLQKETVGVSEFPEDESERLTEIANAISEPSVSLVHLLWRVQEWVLNEEHPRINDRGEWFRHYKLLSVYGLIDLKRATNTSVYVKLTTEGRDFLLRVRSIRGSGVDHI